MSIRQRQRSISRESNAPVAHATEARPLEATPSVPANSSLNATNFEHQFADVNVYATERGPFSPEINSTLSSAFGESIEGLKVARGAADFNANIGARAAAIGNTIFLGDGITESLDAPESMEVIAHEVAHALRPSHGTKFLSTSSDVGEQQAHRAGRSVRQGLEGGRGIAPGSLQAATGGEALVQRWESFEHKRSVDGAIGNLAPGTQVDPAVAAQLQAKIKLANGLEVTPGQITAMMGDMYGRFDEKTGMLDAKGSFDQLNHGDPKEMQKILGLLSREDAGEKIEASDWEGATRNRRGGDGSYLELAQRNDSHFSSASNTGTDNNLGTYSAFHQMALEAAARGDMNEARALESSSMHYLTDRHSAGHNIDKSAVMDASGRDPGGVLANMAVKTAHDDLNENGTSVSDGAGAPWRAYGDGMWESKENEENRQHTAKSVYTSWNELTQAGSGAHTPAELEKTGFGALGTVPQWDQQRQEGAEGMARNTSIPDILWNYGGDFPDALLAKGKRAFGKYVENPVSDAWDWTKGAASTAWDWTKDKVGGAVNKVGETASGAWDWTKKNVGSAVNWAGEKAGNVWDATKETVGNAGEWIGDKAEGAWNAGSKAVDWAGKKAEGAWDTVTDKASGAAGWVDDHFTLDPRKMEFDPRKWF
jgi:hypothetical protein